MTVDLREDICFRSDTFSIIKKEFGTIISLLLSIIVQIVGWDMAKKEYW